MGHVSLALAKYLDGSAEGQFRIFTAKQWGVIWPSLKSLPLICSRAGHWKSGVIPLADVDAATKLVPAVLIGSDVLRELSVC